ncbi:MAG: DUF2283 domain-containing protein [Candidatus Hadarchaeota archaeon]|nr:DUF2283 domain-containing protein [Candidatus Hadarchaeota archaeon]
MKVRYNGETDITLVELSKEKIDHAEEMDNIIVHFTGDNKLAALEILDSSNFLSELTKVAIKAEADESVEVTT